MKLRQSVFGSPLISIIFNDEIELDALEKFRSPVSIHISVEMQREALVRPARLLEGNAGQRCIRAGITRCGWCVATSRRIRHQERPVTAVTIFRGSGDDG